MTNSAMNDASTESSENDDFDITTGEDNEKHDSDSDADTFGDTTDILDAASSIDKRE